MENAAVSITTNGAAAEHSVLLRADNIQFDFDKQETEIIPLGATKIEVVMAEIPLENLKLDATNPRIQFALRAKGITKPTQKQLRETLWDLSVVKSLRRAIDANGGLIEAIIVSGDGTVLREIVALPASSSFMMRTPKIRVG